MKFEALLLGMAFVFPGAAAARAWSYVMHHRSWERLTVIGLGAFLSLLLYSIPQLLGLIDLARLFKPDGTIRTAVLFENGSIWTFLSVTGVGVGAATLAARIALSEQGERWTNRVFGKSLVGAAWGPIAQSIVGKGTEFHLKSGDKIYGAVERVSTETDGHLVVAGPRCWNDETEEWSEPDVRRLILGLESIGVIIAPPFEPSTREDQDDIERQACHPHAARKQLESDGRRDDEQALRQGISGDSPAQVGTGRLQRLSVDEADGDSRVGRPDAGAAESGATRQAEEEPLDRE